MRLYEYESKILFKDIGIPIPKGKLISSIEEIENKAPIVIKAQILSGSRMKCRGVLFAFSKEEAQEKAKTLLGSKIKGNTVEKLLIEEKINFLKEYFLSVTYDTIEKSPVVLFSKEGGVEIETLVKDAPHKVIIQTFNLTRGFHEHLAREIIVEAGLRGKELVQVARILHKLIQLFLRYDAIVAEINPLVQTEDDRFIALDAHIEVEDEALYRHSDMEKTFGICKRERVINQTEFEKKASEIDHSDHRGVAGRVIEFDGDLALLIGGGGASLTSFDAIKKHGGKPANYCEIGGNPSVKKVKELTKLLLSKKGVYRIGVIMNVVSNTRADLIARGVIKGILELGKSPSKIISVFRVPGSWEEEGFKILKHYGVDYCTREVSIDEAAKIAIKKNS